MSYFNEAALGTAVIMGLNFFMGPLADFIHRDVAKIAASPSHEVPESETS